MSTVVCNQQNCKYRSAVFCKRDFVMLNQFGMCSVWFDKNGQMRPVPNYPSDSQVTTEQEFPQEKKSEEPATDLGASE